MIRLEDIKKLSVVERVRLVEDIWDTIPAGTDDIPPTEAQKNELERRLRLLESDPQGRPWKEAIDRIQASQ
jgi:putative addiction module component (TIGR02574 family)